MCANTELSNGSGLQLCAGTDAASGDSAPMAGYGGERPAKAGVGLVLLLGAMTAFGPLAVDMYLPGLPMISRIFHAAPGEAEGTVASFLAGMSIGQLFYGPASDRWGRRPPLLFGSALFVAATLVCALAPSMAVLMVARFIQALGGCAGAVVARAVVRDCYGLRDSARILSTMMLVTGLALVLAPLAGGLLLDLGGWRVIFWVLAGLGVLITAAAFFGLRESRSDAVAKHAMSEHPLRAYLRLLQNKRLVGYVLAGALNSAALFGYISGAPGLLIGTYGIKPDQFGLLLGLNSAGMITLSQLNGWLLHRHSPERIVATVRPISLLFAALMLFSAATGAGGMLGVLVPLFCVMATFGLIGPNTIAGGLNVDPRRAGSISALMGTVQFGCGALAAWAISLIHAPGAIPVASVMLTCIGGSTLALYALARPQRS